MFALCKHYYDGVDEQGNALIVYDAEWRIAGVPIPYAAWLLRTEDGKQRERSILRPLKRDDDHLSQAQLGFRGQWQATAPAPAPIRLYQRGQGFLDWHCHTPKTDFHAHIDTLALCGTGYAESLLLTLVPWRLPISTLHWGRFHSPTHSVVWIVWQGAHPLQLLLHNGVRRNGPVRLGAAQLVAADVQLDFTAPAVVRDQALLDLTRQHRLLRPLLKRRFLDSREQKYLSPATLHTPDGQEQGWALYESVQWYS